MNPQMMTDLKESYGIAFSGATPVAGGWKNLKWRVSADKGELLVKQFSTERYSPSRIDQIESALVRQVMLERAGVTCPRIWLNEGRVIRRLADETAYMVMDFCPGQIESADTLTPEQMLSLGDACGAMHTAFARLPAPEGESLPAFGGYMVEALQNNCHARAQSIPPGAPAGYAGALHALEPVLQEIRPDFFDKYRKGFAHEDFQAGNILFDARGVTAVLDFDRNSYSYPMHDVGRAVLGFALENGTLNAEKVRAFARGYSRHSPLAASDIADALRLTWCIETVWWIQPEFFGECSQTARRFKDEMLWLTAHWARLDALVCYKSL